MDGILTGDTIPGNTIPGKSERESNGIEEVHHIPQSSKTGITPSEGLVSYAGHLLGESYFSAAMQSVHCSDLAQNAGKIFQKESMV